MVTKIVKQLNSINTYSKKIIVVSAIASLILCLSGIGVIEYNAIYMIGSLSLYNTGSSLVCASITLFTIFTVGSLLIDLFNAYVNNQN